MSEETHECPECGSTNTELGFIADYDLFCFDCSWISTVEPEAEWYSFAPLQFEEVEVDDNGRLRLRLTADQASAIRWTLGMSLGDEQ